MTTKVSAIAANSRELIVQLSRGNHKPARALAEGIRADLSTILSSDLPTEGAMKTPARQTMFAVEEALALIDQGDLPRSSWESARDVAKEWRAATARE